MTITTRAVKGSQLTHVELDDNFTDLRDGVAMVVPKTQNSGIKVDSLGTPTFGWHDLASELYVYDIAELTAPDFVTYRAGIRQWQFAVNDEAQLRFHLPHDYAMGTDIHIHVHWSHGSTLVTGGGVTWGFELMYAKGHGQAPFGAPIIISQFQTASTTQYQHMVAEGAASTAGGGASLFNTALIEPDGMILGRLYLASNTITVSGGGVPLPFVHHVDIHYQSTNVSTKSRTPDFWT